MGLPVRAQPLRVRAFVGLAVLGVAGRALVSVRDWAFAAGAQAPTGVRGSPLRNPGASNIAHTQASASGATASNLAGAAIGAGAAALVTVAAVRGAAAARQARIAARVGSGSPSLIQILEQKNLLSLAENLKLLSAAENAGVGVATVEELGLLKLLEDYKLLTFAENLLTSPSTPITFLAGAAALGGLSYYEATQPDFGFLQWVLVGALGAPALALGAVALVVLFLTAGTRRTKDLTVTDELLTYNTSSGFTKQSVTKSVSLLDTVEKRQILSFLENNRLLSLAGGLVNRPLTLTEELKVLSTLESKGLLSFVESQVTDTYGPAKVAGGGLPFFLAATLAAVFLPGPFNLILALLLALPGLVFLAVGVGIGTVQPVRGVP